MVAHTKMGPPGAAAKTYKCQADGVTCPPASVAFDEMATVKLNKDSKCNGACFAQAGETGDFAYMYQPGGVSLYVWR
jgi:hypothetical protein